MDVVAIVIEPEGVGNLDRRTGPSRSLSAGAETGDCVAIWRSNSLGRFRIQFMAFSRSFRPVGKGFSGTGGIAYRELCRMFCAPREYRVVVAAVDGEDEAAAVEVQEHGVRFLGGGIGGGDLGFDGSPWFSRGDLEDVVGSSFWRVKASRGRNPKMLSRVLGRR